MLARPYLITRRNALITGAAAMALAPSNLSAATPTTWNTADQFQTFALSNGNLTIKNAWKILTIAYDIDNAKAWCLDGSSQLWNNDAGADPASGTGGYVPTSLASGAVFPMWSGYRLGNEDESLAVFNFGASTITHLPSGFSSCNTAAGASVTLDPSNKSADITLSGGDLTALKTGSNGTSRSVKATHSFSSGKICYEVAILSREFQVCGFGVSGASNSSAVGADNNSFGAYNELSGGTARWRQNASFQTVNSMSSNTNSAGMIRGTNPIVAGSKRMFEGLVTRSAYSNYPVIIGIASSAASLSSACGSDAQGYGQSVVTGALTFYITNGASSGCDILPTNTILGIYVDDANKRLWFYDNSTGKYNSSPTATPTNPSSGLDYSAFSGVPFPAFSRTQTGGNTGSSPSTFAANFSGPFTSPAVSGYVAWDAVATLSRNRGYIIQ